MGGIAGWIGAGAPPAEAALGPMLQAPAHRGTGEGGAVRMRRGVLGAPGPQPLHDAQAGIAVALDGEIGNRQALQAQLAPRGYRFEDFREAMAFVNRLADASEEANHHPDITISWNAVTVRWWTHVKRAITDTDVEMARRTDELASSSSSHS